MKRLHFEYIYNFNRKISLTFDPATYANNNYNNNNA